LSAGGAMTVTAAASPPIEATAIAAAASISGATTSPSVAVSIGLALAHNRIDKDVTASIVNIPVLHTGGHDVIVHASDAATIKVVSVAAAVSLAIGGTAVGVAGGASESTNIILGRTNAFIENSAVGSAGSAGNAVGKVEI